MTWASLVQASIKPTDIADFAGSYFGLQRPAFGQLMSIYIC